MARMRLNNADSNAPEVETLPRTGPNDLSEREITLLRLLIHRNRNRQRFWHSATLRVCLDGREHVRCSMATNSTESFTIPIESSYIEVFGDDAEGELLLGVFPVPSGDGPQSSAIAYDLGNVGELTILSPQSDDKEAGCSIVIKRKDVSDLDRLTSQEYIEETKELWGLLFSAISKQIKGDNFDSALHESYLGMNSSKNQQVADSKTHTNSKQQPITPSNPATENNSSNASVVALEDDPNAQSRSNVFWLSNHMTQDPGIVVPPNKAIADWILSQYRLVFERCVDEMSLSLNRISWSVPQVGGLTIDQSLSSNVEVSTTQKADENSRSIEKEDLSEETNLNSRYSFDSFVVADCNRFAHAAARAVSESPGQTYNPLYIYGDIGLGKTHLIQATGRAIKQHDPRLRVAYLSLERFMNELINAIRYGYDKTRQFRNRYRSIDVLLIDDIQFIAGKERTQEEFFHTFNALFDAQKQIVLTSDCPPREIPEIDERLHSRFEWGLLADIEAPDLETKIAILKRKAEVQHVELSEDVAQFLAIRGKHNIRELEGSLIKLLAVASLRGKSVSLSLAQEIMQNTCVPNSSPSVLEIQEAVANHYHLSIESLKSRSNTRFVLVPRQIAMYLCKRLTERSYPEIARQFGGKHHTTVIHSVEKIDQCLTTDPEMSKVVNLLLSEIQREQRRK